MNLTYGSVCSGIESASVAWEPFGFAPAWFAEVDQQASDVLAYRFPKVANLGDMTTIPGLLAVGAIEAPDILVGGTPCQSWSIAGARQGLADARGQLSLTYVEIVDELDRQRDEPCIAVWENVPGVLSSHDNGFGCFLAALAGDEEPLEPGERPAEGKSNQRWSWKKPKGEQHFRHVPKWPVAGVVVGPKRTVGWIVRDAQYFGLAQRRRRVFVVASARAGFDPGAILFEFDSVRRDSPPSRETGEGVATSADGGVESGGNTFIPSSFGRYTTSSSSSTLRAAGGDYGGGTETLIAGPCDGPNRLAYGGGRRSGPLDVAATKVAAGQKLDFEVETFIAEPVTAFSSKDYGADATEDCAPTLRASGHDESHANGGSPPAVAYSIMPMNSGKDYKARETDIAQPIMAAGPVGGNQGGDYIVSPIAYAIQERAVAQNPSSGPDGVGVRADDCAYTLEARSTVQAVAFVQNSRDEVRLMGGDGSIVGALAAEQGSHQTCHVAVLPFDTTQITSPGNYSKPRDGDPCHPLASGAHPPAVCVTEPVTHTLKAEGFDASEDGTGRGQPITPTVCFQTRIARNGRGYEEEIVPALNGADAGATSDMRPCVAGPAMAVRRLMPVECERLQGFPDNWTRIPVRRYSQRTITKTRPAHQWEPDPDGKHWWLMAADGPRYKQLGNSMAVPVMRWLGFRIRWWLMHRDSIVDLVG